MRGTLRDARAGGDGRRQEMARDARYFSLASRIAAEMGRSLSKPTMWMKDSKSDRQLPGADRHRRGLPEHEALEMCWRAIDRCLRRGHGAQHLPVQRAARHAEGGEERVHENLSAREALQFWQEEKQGEAK